jgi:urease accessory protein
MSLYRIGRSGELRLTFNQRDTRTALVENYSRPPLQVMGSMHDAAGCLCAYVVSPSGGIVQNDQYFVQICLNPGTHALLTTPAANRVYRMPTGYATQRVEITLGEESVFEYVPDATILFGESDFRQTMDVTLSRGSLLILQDIIMPGRLARNEHLQFRHYASRLVVRDDCGLLLYDNVCIIPTEQNLMGLGFLESYACWGNFYILGDLAHWQLDASAFCAAHRDILTTSESMGAITPLHRNGLCVRLLSHRLETITDTFETLRQSVRASLGLKHEKLRK